VIEARRHFSEKTMDISHKLPDMVKKEEEIRYIEKKEREK
jgi:hypothetical protein